MFSGRSIVASLIVCLSCLSAVADSFVKITQSAGKNGSGTGCSSATLIGWTVDCANGIFISCAHGYDAARSVQVLVDRETERMAEGRIIDIDRELELSLIA